MFTRIIFLVASLSLLLVAPLAWSAPKIAVTDLSYEEKVEQYFRSVSLDYRDTSKDEGGRQNWNDRTDLSYREHENTQISIDRGELHKFTADIKGGLIRAGYPVVQGRPFAMKDKEKLFDIIARIKQGYYKGADYVLFGTISSVEFREESSPIAGTVRTSSESLSLELVAEFSLIDTRTYAITAAFSAMGEGSDVRLQESASARVSLSHGKAVSEATKSIAQDAIKQLLAQLTGDYSQELGAGGGRRDYPPGEEEVTIYR